MTSRRAFLSAVGAGGALAAFGGSRAGESKKAAMKIGMIGLSVHSADFTEIINGGPGFENFRVTVCCHPPGNPDVEFSEDQLGKFTAVMQKHGVKLVGSIGSLLEDADAVMLLTNDGRPHPEQVLPVLKAGKPVYIDKPVAENLKNVVAIYNASGQYKTPVFSSSALRYTGGAQKIAGGEGIGRVLGADTYGPAPLQASHVDLFWDGIHAIELLFTVMGVGCRSVSRTHTPGADVVTGVWSGGRIGVCRGLRSGRIAFGGTVYGTSAIADIGKFDGYKGLVLAITRFFETGVAPVTPAETLEIYAFMEAAQESGRRGGSPVNVAEVLALAEKAGR